MPLFTSADNSGLFPRYSPSTLHAHIKYPTFYLCTQLRFVPIICRFLPLQITQDRSQIFPFYTTYTHKISHFLPLQITQVCSHNMPLFISAENSDSFPDIPPLPTCSHKISHFFLCTQFRFIPRYSPSTLHAHIKYPTFFLCTQLRVRPTIRKSPPA